MLFSSLSTGETIPGGAVPDDAQRGSDADWRTWIKGNFQSVAHPIGTAAMMKRSLGGQYKIVFLSNCVRIQIYYQVSSTRSWGYMTPPMCASLTLLSCLSRSARICLPRSTELLRRLRILSKPRISCGNLDSEVACVDSFTHLFFITWEGPLGTEFIHPPPHRPLILRITY